MSLLALQYVNGHKVVKKVKTHHQSIIRPNHHILRPILLPVVTGLTGVPTAPPSLYATHRPATPESSLPLGAIALLVEAFGTNRLPLMEDGAAPAPRSPRTEATDGAASGFCLGEASGLVDEFHGSRLALPF